MASATEMVTDFVKQWEQPGGFERAVEQYFTDETVWENVGMLTTTGKQEAMAFFSSFGESTGMSGMRVDNLAVAEIGNKVLTERIDHVLDKDGNAIMSIRVMGIFELDGSKITAWRDYFDTAGLAGGGQ
ncbi:MAG: nuclear transport factor 2 family protein [Novosphingobium sp.]|nr:nuclear transport factor 2 family protein [Novosphingobium sp.]